MDILWFQLQLFSSLPLVGLIWTVQLLVYPNFFKIPESEFVRFHERHSFKISLIVLPLMLTELLAALVLFIRLHHSEISLLVWLNVISVLLVWMSTFLIQVPLHQRLSKGKKDSNIRALVLSNWIRSVLWTARAVLLFFILQALNNPSFRGAL